MTKKSTIFFMYGFLNIASLISIFPLVWMVIAATNRSVDVVAGKLTIGGNLFRNYLNLTSSQNVWKFFFNSAKYAVLTTVLSLFVCSLAGYAFEIYHDKWKDRLFTVILMTMMLPFVALMVPLFQMFSKARLLNSTLGFLLPSLSAPLLIMMFRQAAKSFPGEIIEAARLDDAGELKIILRIMIPMARPAIFTIGLLSFISSWNSYFWPLIMTTKDAYRTLPIGVAMLNSQEGGRLWNVLMAGNMFLVVPILIVYLFANKQIRKAFAYSGIK